jgi:hypothetical protein
MGVSRSTAIRKLKRYNLIFQKWYIYSKIIQSNKY